MTQVETPAAPARRAPESTSFVVLCRDTVNGPAIRAAHTRDHLAYIETVMGELNVAGPLFDDTGKQVIGSLYCLHTRSLSRAREGGRAPLYPARRRLLPMPFRKRDLSNIDHVGGGSHNAAPRPLPTTLAHAPAVQLPPHGRPVIAPCD